MNAEQYLKNLIGELYFQIAILQAEIATLKAKDEDKSDRPTTN